MKSLSYIYQHWVCDSDMKTNHSFGNLPAQFYVASFNDISIKIADGTHATPTYVDEGVPFYSVESVVANNFTNVKYISEELHETLCKRVKPQKGDILLTRIGSISKTKLIDWDVDASIYVSLCLIRLNDDVNKEYVYQYTKSDYFRQEIEKRALLHATPMKINLGEIGKIPVPLPHEKEEQARIAKILSDADKKTQLIERKVSEVQELKKGLMQKLFSEGVGELDDKGEWLPHTEFQDSVYGSIPAVWTILKINEVLSYVDYRGKTPPKVESGFFLVTAKNVKSGYIDYESSKEYIPESLYDEVMSRGTPKLGDVLFTTEAPMGNIALVDNQDVAIAQRIIKFRPKSWRQLNNIYLKYFFLSPAFKKELDFNGTGSTVKGIKGKRLHVMKIAIPPIKEQIKIARILLTVDKKIDLLNQQKAEAQQLKKGLMQKLLTGEWRVPLDDQAA